MLNLENHDEDFDNDVEYLYSKLIKPLLPQNKSLTRLVIVPHGRLHNVLFETLSNGKGALVNRFPGGIARALGLNFFARREDFPKLDLRNSAFFGDASQTLPNANLEAKDGSLLFGSRAFLDNKVTKNNFMKSLCKCDLVHFAGHSFFNSQHPMRSSLLFKNGELQAQDILHKLSSEKVKCKLLVLSSCHSGQAHITHGNEIFGLIRACMMIGIERLALSLTNVADVSSFEFFTKFYEKIQNGMLPDQALSSVYSNYHSNGVPQFKLPAIALF